VHYNAHVRRRNGGTDVGGFRGMSMAIRVRCRSMGTQRASAVCCARDTEHHVPYRSEERGYRIEVAMNE
jgi:hypothetical protein